MLFHNGKKAGLWYDTVTVTVKQTLHTRSPAEKNRGREAEILTPAVYCGDGLA